MFVRAEVYETDLTKIRMEHEPAASEYGGFQESSRYGGRRPHKLVSEPEGF